MCSDSKSPTSGGWLGSGLWNRPWGEVASPPCTPLAWGKGFREPLKTLLDGELRSDEPVTSSSGWVGTITEPAMAGGCGGGIVMLGSGPESWVHSAPLWACG